MTCPICSTALQESKKIKGLLYCNVCRRFDLEHVTCNLRVHEILRELKTLTNSEAIIFSVPALNLVYDIIEFNFIVYKTLVEILNSSPDLLDEIKNTDLSIVKSNLKKCTTISHRKIDYGIDVYAYALGLINAVEEYEGENADDVYVVKRFCVSKPQIKRGESVVVEWSIVPNCEITVTLTEGEHVIAQSLSGKITITPTRDTIYTLYIKSEHSEHFKDVSVKIIKRSIFSHWLLWLIIGIIAAISGIELYQYKSVMNHYEQEKAKDVVMDYNAQIPGIYDIEMYECDQLPNNVCTAEIVEENGQYKMTITSEYEPEYHYFKLEDEQLISPTLGYGKVAYKHAINKTTITFENNSKRWVFTK